jgi:hypothetical protein
VSRVAALALCIALSACARDDTANAAFQSADSLLLNGRYAEARPRIGV